MITKDMLISEVVERYPQVAEIFLEYGLHCVGCHVSHFETIEQGAKGHGMLDEEIEMMVDDANTIAKEYKPAQSEEVLITQAAINRVRAMAKKDAFVFRVKIIEGGCSGYSYQFTIEDEPNENDKILLVHDTIVVMDHNTYEKLKGCTIDYIDTLAQSAFKVHNPNAQTTCGCGSSFA